jgi:hypothetical protein
VPIIVTPSASTPVSPVTLELLEFDAAGSNVDGTDPGTPLLLMGSGAGYGVTAFSSPAPAPKLVWGSSIDTDGARRADPSTYENRQVQLTVECFDSGSTNVNEDALRGKVAKLHREGGTLKWSRKDGSVRVFDILASDGWSTSIDLVYENGIAVVSLSFLALPRIRAATVTQADRIETTLPALIATEAALLGDVTGTGALTIDNDASLDWWGVLLGLEQDHDYTFTDSTGSGGLFYQAESRTALGGSATAAGPAGASGSGSNVMRNTALFPSYQAILSSQASGGGAHWTHAGTFRVVARVHAPSANVGTVTIAVEYGQGDFRTFTRNDNDARQLGPGLTGAWRLANLGLVTIPRVENGAQRWEARIVARSTAAGDDIDIDWLALFPTQQGYAEVQSIIRSATPTVVSARDEFDQAAGALTAKVLPVGGTWAGAGDADDFTVDAGLHVAQRTATGDTSEETGRYALAGTGTFTNTAVTVDYTSTLLATSPVAGQYMGGILARYTDVSNWLWAGIYVDRSPSDVKIKIRKRVAGTVTDVATLDVFDVFSAHEFTENLTYSMALQVDTTGRASFWINSTTPVMTVADSALATGGALASGRVGLYDVNSTASASTRTFDNFVAWVPVVDMAVPAGQSLAIRSNSALREDPTGSFWQRPSRYIGSYLQVPPAGAEARNCRYMIKPLLHPEDPAGGTWLDDRIDDMSARLTYEPGYL